MKNYVDLVGCYPPVVGAEARRFASFCPLAFGSETFRFYAHKNGMHDSPQESHHVRIIFSHTMPTANAPKKTDAYQNDAPRFYF